MKLAPANAHILIKQEANNKSNDFCIFLLDVMFV